MVLLTTGCGDDGGGSGDDDDDMPEAFSVLGQADFTSSYPNRGGAAAGGTVAQPLGNIAVTAGKMFIPDTVNSRVLGYTSIPTAAGAPADFVLGQPDAETTTPGTSATKFALPVGVFVGEGRLVVSDSGNNRVLIWNTVPEAAVAPDIVVGQSDFVSSAANTSDSALSFPTAAVIANGHLIVVDQNNNRVLVWGSVPTANGAAADVVIGQPDFTTRDADDEGDEMNRPASVWSDGFQLLVADSGNHRVLYWVQLPQQSGDDADYVLGQTSFSRSTAGAGSSGMRTPFGVTSDGTSIYVADAGNHRVLQFDQFPIAHGATANELFGQSTFTKVVANDDDQDDEVDDTPSARTLNGPTGVHVFSGVLYVTDRNNNRVLLFPQ
jgi:hypothetical protein